LEGFRKPDRRARGKFSDFLYLDAAQTADVLSGLEGGLIDELRSMSEEEGNKGGKLGGAVGYGPLKAEASLSRDQKARREEEVLLTRTGYARITTLLDKLREVGAIGTIGQYTPDVYDQIDVGELYEFKGELRLHPFHQFVAVVEGWAEAGRDLGPDDSGDRFRNFGKTIEDTFYGKNRDRTVLCVFSDVDGAEPEYRVVMSVKKEHILADLEEFSGRATFVAQVQRKVQDGEKVAAARLVRRTPIISPAEQQIMLDIIPALQNVPGTEDIGLETAEGDISLRKPAIVVKALCIYRG
jgi:hypothetical protein